MDNEQAEQILEENTTAAELELGAEPASTQAPEAEPPAQPALVPMSEDELRDAGKTLARLNVELARMTREHAAERTEMADERKQLRERIENVAQQIQQQGR